MTDHAAALAYEMAHEPEEGELTYASAEVREECVRRALAAGWRFDRESAARGDWPWYVLMEEDDGRCVRRADGWRLYVETAAEALAELGTAGEVALVTVGGEDE